MAGGKSAILSVKILGDASSAVKAMHETEDAGGGLFSKITGGLPSAAMIGTALAGAAVVATKALWDIGTTFDEVEDTIRVGTEHSPRSFRRSTANRREAVSRGRSHPR